MVCPCKFPILLVYDDIKFIALPLEEYEHGAIELPSIYDEKNEEGEWVVVRWNNNIHENLESFDVAGHIVLAGCSKNDLSCSSKSIYMVKHPKNEWDEYHIINLDKKF